MVLHTSPTMSPCTSATHGSAGIPNHVPLHIKHPVVLRTSQTVSLCTFTIPWYCMHPKPCQSAHQTSHGTAYIPNRVTLHIKHPMILHTSQTVSLCTSASHGSATILNRVVLRISITWYCIHPKPCPFAHHASHGTTHIPNHVTLHSKHPMVLRTSQTMSLHTSGPAGSGELNHEKHCNTSATSYLCQITKPSQDSMHMKLQGPGHRASHQT